MLGPGDASPGGPHADGAIAPDGLVPHAPDAPTRAPDAPTRPPPDGAAARPDAPLAPDAGLAPDARPVPDGPLPADAALAADAPLLPDAPSGDACGGCPDGYHCGTANSIAVCRSDQTGIPLFSHVFVIVMENLSLSTLEDPDNRDASPFLHSLEASAAYSTDYHGVAHPSLPNYLALTSGATQGVECDCSPAGSGSCNDLVCNTLIHSCSCAQGAAHIADELENAGLSWQAYGEDMGTPCNLVDSGSYATRHVPFLYYNSVQLDTERCSQHVVDYSAFATGPVPEFVFIAPNLVHDMHDPVLPGGRTNITNGDSWLSSTGVAAITALPAYQSGGLLVIVWDEDDYSGVLSEDDPIPMFVLSPYAKAGYASPVRADHYSLLATFQDGLGLPRLANSAGAQPLSDFFPEE
jgi:hypothetical protein